VFHSDGAHAGTDENYLFGSRRISGPIPSITATARSPRSKTSDGNGWLFQELTTRLPGRIDSAATTFASANDLANAMRRASKAHSELEASTGGQRDENWPTGSEIVHLLSISRYTWTEKNHFNRKGGDKKRFSKVRFVST